MKPSLARALLTLGLLAGLAPAGGASPLIDPFLERFRVGACGQDGNVPLRDGWPADLFAPCRLDSLWLASAESLLSRAPADGGALACADILDAALGDAAARRRWIAGQRARLTALATPQGADSAAWTSDWLFQELLEFRAVQNYQYGNYGIATIQAERLLAATAPAMALPPEARFVWSLRLRRLRELATGRPTPPEATPWPELLALGSYDADSGWALWRARQRALGRPLLPPGCASDEWAVFLTRLGQVGLAAAEIDSAGFSPGALAAVGVVCLEPGAARDRHIARQPSPPADPPWQEIWLRARLRASGWDPALAEKWGPLPELRPSARVLLWRRAAEERLLAGEWALGLADLGRAFAAARGSPALRAPVAASSQQALVLAGAQRRYADLARIRDLAREQLTADEWRAWQQVVRHPMARFGHPSAPDSAAIAGLENWARERVRAGLSPAARRPAAGDSPASWPGPARLWDPWLRWGAQLRAHAPMDPADVRAAEYGDALAQAAAAPTAADRAALARRAVGLALRGHPGRDIALRWLLERERRRLAGPAASLAGPATPAAGERVRAWPDGHALLGLALAAGDAHAQIVMARDLPGGDPPDTVRLPLLYPVPADSALRDVLTGAGLDPALLLATMRNESLFDPGVRSRAGALGLLQVMPFHFPDRGVPDGTPLWRYPLVSLRTGARLLGEAARAFDGDPYRACAAYNAGEGAVRRWIRQLGGRTEPVCFLVWIGYAETRAYVEKVLIDREIYGWILSSYSRQAP